MFPLYEIAIVLAVIHLINQHKLFSYLKEKYPAMEDSIRKSNKWQGLPTMLYFSWPRFLSFIVSNKPEDKKISWHKIIYIITIIPLLVLVVLLVYPLFL